MKYDSIINLPHYEPKYHKRMSKMQRAAQFNPFSALTGYDDMVKEVSRVVNERIEISEDKKEEILRLIDEQENLTDEIAKSIENAVTLSELEDIYRPFRPKRRTKSDYRKRERTGTACRNYPCTKSE